jgi:ABC-type dipeptide/oligopeptide/nickel transport system permease component
MIYSYVDNIFSCEGGFYSANQITVRQTPGLEWYILFTILLSVVFNLIIDSY